MNSKKTKKEEKFSYQSRYKVFHLAFGYGIKARIVKIRKKLFSTRQTALISSLIFLSIGAGIYFAYDYTTKGATHGWIQDDWSGGITADPAIHPDGKTGWDNYLQADSNVDTATPGEIDLSNPVGDWEDSTDADFEATTTENIMVANDSAVLLKPDGASCTSHDECYHKCHPDTNVCDDVVIDACNNLYSTVTIGNQTWLDENMNCDVHSAGSSWCYKDNSSNCDTYGRLYTWAAAMDGGIQGVCPDGFHVPTDAEWHELENYLATGSCDAGRSGYDCDPAGTALKSGGSSGFNALFAGYRLTNNDSFYHVGWHSYFWSSSSSDSNAINRRLSSSNSTVDRDSNPQANGYSIRCLKD